MVVKLSSRTIHRFYLIFFLSLRNCSTTPTFSPFHLISLLLFTVPPHSIPLLPNVPPLTHTAIIVLIVVSAVAVSLFTSEPPKPPTPIIPAALPPSIAQMREMRDVGVGTDDELMEDTAGGSGSGAGRGGGVISGISDERLEKLLSDKGVAEIAEIAAQQQQARRRGRRGSRGGGQGQTLGEGGGGAGAGEEVFVDRI